MHGFWVALRFLTILPGPALVWRPGSLEQASPWFPVVGLVLAVLLAVAHWLLLRLFPPLPAAALLVALWAFLTGGLHLDGLADCCDGLFAAVSPSRRLEILRDPSLGAFGGTGLAIFLILKVTAVAALVQPATALFLAPVMGRWLILLVSRHASARPDGMSAALGRLLEFSLYVPAALLPVGLVILAGWRGLVAALLAHGVALGLGRLARIRLGGVTGDVYGMVIELAELVVLLVFTVA